MTVYPTGIMAKINMGLSRVNIRINIFTYTLFVMFSRTQQLNGIMSRLPNGNHVIFFDSIDCDLNKLKEMWLPIQKRHNLSNCYILSDKENSFRIWCFNQVSFQELLIILLEAKPLMDWSFYVWTVNRGYATIRTSNKVNREQQKIIDVLESYYISMPMALKQITNKVIYETGIEKRGLNILLGDKING